ncbi:MAG: hypothetical protein [Caudoviricetes sp.]|nr:MAG: hypothetical protein [Caudoviricetes sp.]
MNQYYTNIELIGNNILERYLIDGVEHRRKVPFEPSLFTHSQAASAYQDIYGRNVQEKFFNNISEARQWKKSMQDFNKEVLGMDDFILQYLYKTYTPEIKFDIKEIDIAYVDIEVVSKDGFPEPSICKWEIDALTHYSSKLDTYFVFALRQWCKKDSVLSQDIIDKTDYQYFDSEKELLIAYVNFWRQNTPNILTGWNIERFDLPYIVNRLRKLWGEKAADKLSPWGKIEEKTVYDMGGREETVYKIIGVNLIDYMELYKKFTFVTRPSYKLGYIGQVELGDSKLEYDGPLWQLAEQDPQTYVDYNIKDVDLLVRLDIRLSLFLLVLSVSYYARVNYNNVFSPLKTWDGIIHYSLMQKNVVVPENKKHHKEDYEGAYVKSPIMGYHRWLTSFDLTSLYPKLIMQYNISPETLVDFYQPGDLSEFVNKTYEWNKQDYSCTPNGMMYLKSKRGVIPTEIEKVFNQRKFHKNTSFAYSFLHEKSKLVSHEAKSGSDEKIDISDFVNIPKDDMEDRLRDLSIEQLKQIIDVAPLLEKIHDVQQMARKVLINSLYGALGNEFFRYYDIRNADAVTSGGRLSIQWIERKLNEFFNRLCKTENHDFVAYIDTDSVYLALEPFIKVICDLKNIKEEDWTKTQWVDFIDKFAKEKVEPYILKSYQELADYMNAYEQQMFMDREAIADTGFWTAKKRYCLNVWDNEGKRVYDENGNLKPKLKIMGIETQRSSTPPFVTKSLKESIRLILQSDEQTLQDYVSKVSSEYRTRPYQDIASVTSANNIEKYCDNKYNPLKGCLGHIKGVLAYNRMSMNFNDVDPIRSGEKVQLLIFKPNNPTMSEVFAFPSGGNIPDEFKLDLKKTINYDLMYEKHFLKPLLSICGSIKWKHEPSIDLTSLFDI